MGEPPTTLPRRSSSRRTSRRQRTAGRRYQEIQWANFTQTFSSAIASNTGPAVSTGGGFQAFQYAEQGAIAYADNVIDKLQEGRHLRRLPARPVEAMKTAKGYAAVPWQLDIRVWWYNKSTSREARPGPAHHLGRDADRRQGARSQGVLRFRRRRRRRQQPRRPRHGHDDDQQRRRPVQHGRQGRPA